MKLNNKIFSSVLIASLTYISLTNIGIKPASARQQVCQVTDPTGTPLNVRSSPNGRIINALRNGREVNVLKIAYDSQGRPWAYVGGFYRGEYRYWGWVFREFISCYNR